MSEGKRERPASPKNADVEIAAGAKASELRFEEVPETETRFRGNSGREAASGSDRQNLPGKVEPEVTYRNASIQWRAAARLVEGEPEPGEFTRAEEPEKRADRREPGHPEQETGGEKPAEREAE